MLVQSLLLFIISYSSIVETVSTLIYIHSLPILEIFKVNNNDYHEHRQTFSSSTLVKFNVYE